MTIFPLTSAPSLTSTLPPTPYPTSYPRSIVNPNFSIPAEPANSYSYIQDLSVITGWSFSGYAPGKLIVNHINPFNNRAMPAGTTQALTVQMRDGHRVFTVAQLLLLIPGIYRVAFYALPRPLLYNTRQRMSASLNKANVTTSLRPSDGWTLYSFVTTINTRGVYPLSFNFTTMNTGLTDTAISLTGIHMTLFPLSSAPSLSPTLLPTVKHVSLNFTCIGATQNFTVPSGVSTISVSVYGAQGGLGRGGKGGYGGHISADINVNQGHVLYVNVGCAGGAAYVVLPVSSFNGGGRSTSDTKPLTGGGGGGSDIRTLHTGLGTRMIVAGGGGGGSDNGAGGAGGGLVGQVGFGRGNALGGTQSYGGPPGGTYPNQGFMGYIGHGGVGRSSGSGGGGYYGGGGGGLMASVDNAGGGGGGGSSWLSVGKPRTSTQGVRQGDGLISISYVTGSTPY
jgi:Glycine rich protein